MKFGTSPLQHAGGGAGEPRGRWRTRLARQQIPERGGGRGATAGGHARTGEQEPTRLAFDDVRHA